MIEYVGIPSRFIGILVVTNRYGHVILVDGRLVDGRLVDSSLVDRSLVDGNLVDGR